MRKVIYSILILLTTIKTYHCYSQESVRKFSLVGKINLESGLIKLVPLDGDGKRYYPVNTIFESKIENGNFSISGKIPYTMAYQIFVKDRSKIIDVSNIIYLDTGAQFVKYYINELHSLPSISNKTMKELNDFFISKGVERSDSVLLNYSKLNSDSYITLWQLVSLLENDGYSSIKENIYKNLSPKIRNTYTGRKVEEILKSAKTSAIGQTFPALTLVDSNIQKTRLSTGKNFHSKIVLVDFWFSHCNPCISQFSELIRLYNEYHIKGFEIVGISVDDKPLIKDWESVVRNYKLPWIQYLDLKGVEAKKLSVVTYPSNFLLNQQGKIISKKISLKDLEYYLKNSLNSD